MPIVQKKATTDIIEYKCPFFFLGESPKNTITESKCRHILRFDTYY